MGASESAGKWQDEYQIIERSSPNGIIKARHKVHHDRFDIISTHVVDQSDKQQLFSRINKRETRKSPFIVPLLRACHNQQEFLCNSTEKYDLIFMESTPTLLDLLKFRQARRENFSNEEILHVIKNVAFALKDFRQLQEQYGTVTLNNIVIKGRAMLKDNFLVKEEQRDYFQSNSSRKVKGYPSPQKIKDSFDKLTDFQQFPADLFSLGVVALQLCYPLISIKDIYINKNPHYENNRVNFQMINSLVLGISSALLKQAIIMLLSFEPNERLGIYGICETFAKETSKLRMLKQNPWHGKKEDELLQPIKPYEHVSPSQFHILKSEQSGYATTNSHTNGTVQKVIKTASPQYQTYQPPLSFRGPTSGIETLAGSNYKNIKFAKKQVTPNYTLTDVRFNKGQKPPTVTFNDKLLFNNSKQLPTSLNLINFQSNKAIDSQIGKHHQQIKSNIAPAQSKIFPSFSSFTNQSRHNSITATAMPVNNQIITDDVLHSNDYDFTQIQYNANYKGMLFSFEKSKEPVIQQSRHLRNLEQLLTVHNPINSIAQTKAQSQKSQNQDKAPEYIEEEYQVGTRYEGYKTNGKRNGQGKFFYKEGSHYEGNWTDNRMDGKGVLYYPDGKIAYNGQWENDEFCGKGIIYNDKPIPIAGAFDYTNFSPLQDEWLCYEGDLKHDAKWGVGKLLLTNGEYYEGQFQNDIIHGQGTFTRMNGNKVHGIWSNSCLRKIIA